MDNMSNKLCQAHLWPTYSLRINVTFSCKVIHSSMRRKLGGNRTYGRAVCPGSPRILYRNWMLTLYTLFSGQYPLPSDDNSVVVFDAHNRTAQILQPGSTLTDQSPLSKNSTVEGNVHIRREGDFKGFFFNESSENRITILNSSNLQLQSDFTLEIWSNFSKPVSKDIETNASVSIPSSIYGKHFNPLIDLVFG